MINVTESEGDIQTAYINAAGEPVEVKTIGKSEFVFGTELAVLRLYHRLKSGRIGFAKSMGKWFWTEAPGHV
jgi:hypothetical protein